MDGWIFLALLTRREETNVNLFGIFLRKLCQFSQKLSVTGELARPKDKTITFGVEYI